MSSLLAAAVPDKPADPVLPRDENPRRGVVLLTVVLQVGALVAQARVDTSQMGSLGDGRVTVGRYAGYEVGGVVHDGYKLVHGISCWLINRER
jgi:hypothetical protein